MRVLVFGPLREAIGAAAVDVAEAATAADVRRLVAKARPAAADLVQRCAVAVNGEYAVDDTPVSPGDEVALIPPVSGGQASRAVVWFCLAVMLGMGGLLAVITALSYTWLDDPRELFDEGSPATWSSVLCFGVTAFLGFRVRGVLAEAGERFARFWTVLGVSFTLAALDDALRLHERADKLILRLAGLPDEGIYDHLDDVLILGYGLVVGTITLAYLPRIWRLRGFVAFGVVGTSFFAVTVLGDLAGWPPFVEEGGKMMAAASFLCGAATADDELRRQA